MSLSVITAFNTFLNDTVRIAKDKSDLAKSSKGFLIDNIKKFPAQFDFPDLHQSVYINYGSFARKTKIRPLDDIDLMIILHADYCIWEEDYNGVHIRTANSTGKLKRFENDFDNTLNSRKILFKLKEHLMTVSNYKNADMKLNQEAVTLELSSYEWVYDIVPAFITTNDIYGRSFYLIPDGSGGWKKTDPRVDRARTVDINSKHKASVLDIIRLFKYWTKRATMPTIKSYFLENMILDYYDKKADSSQYVDWEFKKVISHIYSLIDKPFDDPKGFQGNINHLKPDEIVKIKTKIEVDYANAVSAIEFETDKNYKESIRLWGTIFGPEFPAYG